MPPKSYILTSSATLRAMNFPERFITWVMMSFRQSEVQIIVNGFLTDPYNPGAGGKQGDPLFPHQEKVPTETL